MTPQAKQPLRSSLRLDPATPGPRPYRAIYHEYPHPLTSRSLAWLALWLAEFYVSTMIQSKRVLLGAPNKPHVLLLCSQSLLPPHCPKIEPAQTL